MVTWVLTNGGDGEAGAGAAGAGGGGGDEEWLGVEAVFGEEDGEVVGGDGVVAGPGVAVLGVEFDDGVAGRRGRGGGGG